MKKFKWILTEDLYKSAMAALAAVGAPVAMHDRDGCDQRFTATAYDGGVDIIREKKFTDARGCEAWSGVDAVGFLPDRFHLRSMGDLALLSLALHAASANCTDDDRKPHTLDGVTTARFDDLDFTAPDGYAWSPHGALLVLYDEDFRSVAEVARGEDESHPWVYMLKNTLPSHGFDDIRNAMSAAERAAVDIAENQDAESISLTKATGMDEVLHGWAGRCPLHGCASGDRTCERAAYNREACAKMVQETVVPPEKPAIEVVDATPAKTHHDRLLRCGEMLLQISEATIVDVFDHLCAIVEVEAVEG